MATPDENENRPRASIVFWLRNCAGYGGGVLALIGFGMLSHQSAFGSHGWISACALIGFGIAGVLACGVIDARFRSAPKLAEDSVDADRDAKVSAATASEETPVLPNLLLLIAPRQSLVRTSETILVHDGYYEHRLTKTFLLPGEEARDATPAYSADSIEELDASSSDEAPSTPQSAATLTYFLPLKTVARGSLVDNLKVWDAAGRQLGTLNSSEGRGLVKHLLCKYAAALTDRKGYEVLFDVGLKPLIDEIEADGPLQGTEDARLRADEQSANVELAVSQIEKMTPSVGLTRASWEKQRDALKQLCRAVADDYIIFVPVVAAPGDRVRINFAYTRPAALPAFSFRQRLRYTIGLRPHEHSVVVGDSGTAESSHHITFEAPPGQYVYSCTLRPLPPPHGYVARPRAKLVVAPCEGAGALDYAHVYARPRTGAEGGSGLIALTVDCREKPPGLIGTVAMVALAQAVIIWTVGLLHKSFFGESGTGPDAAVPTLILALPGLVAGWVGAQFTVERLRWSSLAAVNGIIFAGILAIYSTGLAVAKSAGASWGPLLGIAHPLWALAMVLSGLLAADLLIRLTARSLRFSERVRRKDVLTRDLL